MSLCINIAPVSLKHCGCDILHIECSMLQIVTIQIDVLLTLSTLTPPEQLFNIETHEATKKQYETSVQFHGISLLLNIIIHHLNTHTNGKIYPAH